MALHDGCDERLFTGKVLIERADAHARLFGDAVGAGLVEAVLHENASGCFDQGIDRHAGSLLRRVFSGFRERFPRHFSTLLMRVGNTSSRSYYASCDSNRNVETNQDQREKGEVTWRVSHTRNSLQSNDGPIADSAMS